MSDVRRHLARGVAVAAVCAALVGCVPQGLAFRVDDRLTFRAPEDRSTVRLPVTLDWDIRDFRITEPGSGEPREGAGYFGVFVDASPMPPGRDLGWIARDDSDCRPDDGCPDEEYLSARGVYTTTDTELFLEQLPRGDEGRRERHRATIVLLDSSGTRIGESAFEIAFDVDRGATP